MRINWKAALGILAGIASGAAACRGQTESSDLSVTAATAYSSQYMFRGERLGSQSLEPWVQADTGRLALGVWSNVPLADRTPGNADFEVDPYGSYTIPMISSFSVEPGFTFYTYPRVPAGTGYYSSAFEPNIALSYTAAGVRLEPKAYYNLARDGAIYELNAASAIPLTGLGTEVDVNGTIARYALHDFVKGSLPKVEAEGGYWLLGAAVPVQLSKGLKLTAGWAYTAGTDATVQRGAPPKASNPMAAGRGVATVSLAWTF